MAHIGLVCPHVPGHFHPMSGIGRELQRRGHRVTAFLPPDGHARARAAGIELHSICEQRYPLGTADAILAELGRMQGFAALRFTLNAIADIMNESLLAMPDALRESGVELLLVDEASPGPGSVAEKLGIPWIGVSNALCVRPDPGLPPIFTPWLPGSGWFSRTRNRLFYAIFVSLAGRAFRGVTVWRVANGLPPLPKGEAESSPFAHLSQEPALFAFPRTLPAPTLHNLGPFHDPEGRVSAPFPWEKLGDRPLLYASLGTVQNRQRPLFAAISEAARALDMAVVLSLGGSCEPEEIGPLPGDPLVVRFAPQLALLERAAVCLTHAGMNTALECLARGVPMVALPLANDQPGVSARIVASGAGLRVAARPDPVAIRAALSRVATEPAFRAAAQRMKAHIAEVRPQARAADIVEQVLRTGQPVFATR